MKKANIKSKLSNLTTKELIEIIEEMQQKFDVVDDFLQAKFSKENTDLLKKYKKKISKGFEPDDLAGDFDIESAYEAIESFRKLKTKPEELAEILFHFINEGIQFYDDYGDIDDDILEDMLDYYKETLIMLKENNLLESFKIQCLDLVKRSKNSGYGFGDDINDLYYEYYGK